MHERVSSSFSFYAWFTSVCSCVLHGCHYTPSPLSTVILFSMSWSPAQEFTFSYLSDSYHLIIILKFRRKTMTNLDSILKSRDITLPTKVRIVKAVFFSSSHVQMWELDHKEGWTPKNWFFCTALLEKTLESDLDCKEIKPVNPKENQPWIFIGRTDAKVL